ncbi:MAG: repair protein RecO, partial [Solirubrobacterales bacterium]|nr:repair protein RecO [Solirubrobacterales bacterium]
MPGSLKTEAVVLRSIRYGEADRILHLYSADRGRLSAIAKGSRKPRSRFGGRLEPFFRLDLVLYQGRGERGSMQDEFLVHRREGKACPRCGEVIRRIVVGGRSTYFCPACQVRLRRRPVRRAGSRPTAA